MSNGFKPMDMWRNSGLWGPQTGYNNNPAKNQAEIIFSNLQRNICELAINRFKWSNLPNHIDPRFIEKTLLLNSLVVFYWNDEFDKLLAVKATATGYVNFMEWPVQYTIVGPGSQILNAPGTTLMTTTLSGFIPFASNTDETKVKRQGFPMWPNYLRQSELDTIQIYANRLATTDVTLEINTANARQNKVVTSSTNTQLSMVNLARQIDEGVKVIQPKDSTLLENISTVDLGINPDLFDKLSILRTRWWNDCMGLLGIDNANQDKKERLVAAEVGANDAQTDSMRYVALNARREAIAHVNRVFGYNIEVDFNTEVEEMAKQMAANNGIDPDTSDDENEGK